MSRYDTRTTIFTPDGRLLQVEYALEAINKTPPAIGLVCTDGIILLAEKRSTSALVERMNATEKLHQIDENTICALTGITADANQLLQQARTHSQRHLYTYKSFPSIESTVVEICNIKQSYTQFGGLRPFGVAFLIAGWDKFHGYQLYSTDPAGNYAQWSVKMIGQGSTEASRKLKELCVEDNKEKAKAEKDENGEEIKSSASNDVYELKDIKTTLAFAGRLLAQALGVESIKADGIEGVILRKDPETNKLVQHILTTDELAQLVNAANVLLESINKADK